MRWQFFSIKIHKAPSRKTWSIFLPATLIYMKIAVMGILEILVILLMSRYQESLGRPLTIAILIIMAIVVIRFAIKSPNRK